MEVGMQGARGRGIRIAICALAALFAFGLLAQDAAAEPPSFSEVGAVAVTGTTATLKANVSPNFIDPEEETASYRIEYGPEDCEASGCAVVASGPIPVEGPVEASLEGLSSNTLYHFRTAAERTDGTSTEKSAVNSVFFTRTGVFEGLPDNRAYEQASPTDKDGGDLQGYIPLIKATESGEGITFESTFGVPGGKGAQEFTTYLGSRGASGWSTEGLLPPFSAGQRAQVIGWSPDFTEVFSQVARLGEPRAAALVVQSGSEDPVAITPYTPGGPLGVGAEYAYAGQSTDGSVVLFESTSKLLSVSEAIEGSPNLYAWDRDTGKLSLAGIDNHKTSPAKGTLAGAYLWPLGSSGRPLRLGGSQFGMYLRDQRAISPDGSIYFTEAGSGQLYRRINPTAEQSATQINGKGEEECPDLAKACTVHVSASHKANGKGDDGADGAGPQPAAFQAASADGSEAFFTSSEKLTNDANTGPEQSPARIELGNTSKVIENKELVAPQRALGVAVDSEHLYWIDPVRETISRSDLNGENKDLEFVVPGTIKCEVKGSNPPEFEEVESTPRYVAVDAEYIYWTNTGCFTKEFRPIEGTGTIGRANIEGGVAADPEPEFITGASNPQGIAVNSKYIYWANSSDTRATSRAAINGGDVQSNFLKMPGSIQPYGVALNSGRVYLSANDANNAYIWRVILDAGEENVASEEGFFVGKEGLRGIALDTEHVYWASQGEEAIGRADLELENKEKEFIKLEGKPAGLALAGAHLYWSTNGELPTNPGNDLYRYGPKQGELTDLTVDPSGNGAEVQGVLGASADGKYVYFAANGVLDDEGEAEQGSCKGALVSTSGGCSLYLWHDGAINLIARLRTGGDELNWVATPRELFGTTSYVAKTSFLSADGQTLLFRSQEQLTDYAATGTPEYYRFRVGDPEGIRCVSCSPAGAAASEGARFGRLHFPNLGPLPSVAAVSARVLSADGNKAFFETTEALVPEDTNAQLNKCENVGKGEQIYPSCLDTYEWEAAGSEGCTNASPAYSPINDGCIYLLSTGKSAYPSLFADASASGNDVFFFTRDRLVGQDKDEIQDVYDARVGGGLASQNPVFAVPCEGAESCHGPAQSPPAESAPATPNFHGPVNPKPVHKKPKPKKKKHKAKKHKGKGHHKQKRTGTERRNAR
jgi:sugar lactone lactonase YvrE